MKKLFFLLLCSPFFAWAQDKPLLAEGSSPGLYITHKVEPKENFYSIGRIYNISPREIAPFNNLELEKGLNLDQVIKIPLSSSNFFQSGNAEADEVFVPVYHIVKDKESLKQVAANHNDVPLDDLKQWNNLKTETVKKGMKLIIGYLKVKKELSVLAKNGVGNSIKAKAVAEVKTEKKPVTEETAIKPKPVTEIPTQPVNIEKQPAVKTTDNEKKVATEDVKTTKETESKKTTEVGDGKKIRGGAFKSLFESQEKNAETVNEEGVSGVFKSTSGWKDGKYYCLYNNALPGTIIKVISPANGKFVYAKVLDVIPDLKQNNGLLILISNAAADELGVTENNFNCVLNYSK